jgi:hypothetical protein
LTNGELVVVWDESIVNGKDIYKKICLQIRPAVGKNEGIEYITPDNRYAGYPVIAPLNENAAVVAYTIKKEEKKYVACQLVQVK